MPDSRVLAAILIMGLVAAAGKVLELWDWHANAKPLIDTSTNGGVSSTASDAKVTRL